MVFVQKSTVFLICVFLGKLSHKISFYDILDWKKCFLDRNSKVCKKCKKPQICKGVSRWFLSKIDLFSHLCIFGICGHKRSFFDILTRQESFLDQNSKVKKKVQKIENLQSRSYPMVFVKKSISFSYVCFRDI